MYGEEIPYIEEEIDDLSSEEKRSNWDIALGLQAVDNLKPSKYLYDLAEDHIAGKKTYGEVVEKVEEYHASGRSNPDEKEADIVSIRMNRILAEAGFSFRTGTLKRFHKLLFDGQLPPNYSVGEYRTKNIKKRERVLDGKSVEYETSDMIEEALAADFEKEKVFDYSKISKVEKAHHAMQFISGIWRIHPFREGNTRTTTLFGIKHLRSLGFSVGNEPFRDNSKWYRDALVMDNYTADRHPEYLQMFTENILLGGKNILPALVPALQELAQ